MICLKKAILVGAGIEEFCAVDIFVLQMAHIIMKSYSALSGTRVCSPDDIIEILFPGYLTRQKE